MRDLWAFETFPVALQHVSMGSGGLYLTRNVTNSLNICFLARIEFKTTI